MKTLRLLLVVLCIGVSASVTTADDTDLYVRVVDVGAGLCCVVCAPGDHYMIYDAGNFKGEGLDAALEAIDELIPEDASIDLLVISHSDADHIGAVVDICDTYPVKKIIHPGIQRDDRDHWVAAVNAMEREPGAEVVNLRLTPVAPGEKTFSVGDAQATFVFGLSEPPAAWGFTPTSKESEYYNSGSIVIRLEFAEKAILFCGDTVGRLIGDLEPKCIAAELAMKDKATEVKILSDVIIAPHHGADNGSSLPFIEVVDPTYVIFSAGHWHRHPRTATAKRYMKAGVKKENIYRTDKGDHETTKKKNPKDNDREWSHGRRQKHSDPIGDDDIAIRITSDGEVSVAYANEEGDDE